MEEPNLYELIEQLLLEKQDLLEKLQNVDEKRDRLLQEMHKKLDVVLEILRKEK